MRPEPADGVASELPLGLAQAADEALAALRAALPASPGRALLDSAPTDGGIRLVLAVSEYVREQLLRDPGLLDALAHDDLLGAPADRDALLARAEAALAGCEDEDGLKQALRAVRHRELVRIAWRDIAGLSDLPDCLAELTWLAEALLDGALERLYRWRCRSHGTPTGEDGSEQRLVVLGLGKLGSQELNFSSDIDLMFAYPQPGETVGGARPLANEAFFLRLAQRLIHVLTERTEAGFVYRVDMRLRPFGRSGALAATFDALEDYYQSHGRDWERFALIRARTVAGDHGAGAELLTRLRPFTFRRYLDYGALESLREVKKQINQELRAADSGGASSEEPTADTEGAEEANIKRGRGGIRELEFVVQTFQLLRGGQNPGLRSGSILSVLPRLAERELLPRQTAEELEAAYRFLRRLENRLQQFRDEQTHLLPGESRARARLAAAMGYPSWVALEADLELHRGRIRLHFDSVLGDPAPEAAEDENDPFAALTTGFWTVSRDAARLTAMLREAGMEEAEPVAERVARLRENYRARALDERARRRLASVLIGILRETAAREEPAETVNRVLGVIESVLQRAAYLALLNERPVALAQLVRLCAASPWIAEHLAQHPQSFDELLDPRSLYAPPQRTELAAALAERLEPVPPGDTEQEMNALRYFQQASVLRVAAAEISGGIPLMVVSDRLTELAEICLEQVLVFAWRDLVARYGPPTFQRDGQAATAPFAIIAYGKLGGLELSYGSDLDLVFLHGSEGEAQQTAGGEGRREVDNGTFFARLGQRIIHGLSTHTAAGRLYEADPRLRPSGAAGLLVTSVRAFEEYQRSEAWTWEHQSLVRARPVAGDPALGRRFSEVRRAILTAPRDPESLRAEVREMRLKMHRELGSRPDQPYDLKQDPGGIADIEFLVQYGTLRWAERLGDSIQYTDNVRLLEGFAAHGVLGADDAAFLSDAYRTYRSRVHELDLQERPSHVARDEFAELRERVLALWRAWMDG